MRVLNVYKEDTSSWIDKTVHVNDRAERLKHLRESDLHTSFLVDKNHPNGLEVHSIYSDATIIIYNERTKKLITVLYGRPGQIKRYYQALNLPFPKHIVNQALQNSLKGRNHL